MQDSRNDNMMEIDLGEIFGLLLHKLWILILFGILAGAAGYAISTYLITPKYESTTGIYVMSKQNGDTLSYSDTQLASQLTKDYEELITCRYVLETVITECGLEDTYNTLKDRITVQNATNTRIIYITVKDTNPARAQAVADSIREVASEHIKSVTNVEAVNVVDEANYPKEPSEPSVVKYTAIAALLGMMVIAAIIILRYLADDTIKFSEDVSRYLDWSTLALIPVITEETGKKKVSKKEAKREAKTAEKTSQTSEINISTVDEG